MTSPAQKPLVRRWRVEEKGRRRWAITVSAPDAEAAIAWAAASGFDEPATVEEITAAVQKVTP